MARVPHQFLVLLAFTSIGLIQSAYGSKCPAAAEPSMDILCYYEGTTPLDQLNICNCTHLVFTKLATVENYTLTLSPDSKLSEKAAHDLKKLSLILTVSLKPHQTSSLLKSEENRIALLNSISESVRTSEFSGVELDFQFTADDGTRRENLTTFVRDLRTQLDHHRVKRSSYSVFEEHHDDFTTGRYSTERSKTKPTKKIIRKKKGRIPRDDKNVDFYDEEDLPVVDEYLVDEPLLKRTKRRRQRVDEEGEIVEKEESDGGKEYLIYLRLSTVPEIIAKKYDLKPLSKYVDYLTVPTHWITDETEKQVTFHPSRLMGLSDMLNTDSILDLLTGLGAPKSKIIIFVPGNVMEHTLKDPKENSVRAPTVGEPRFISHTEMCGLLKGRKWTVERDEDLTAPYAFSKTTWLAFEDETSVNIKGKYILLRELAGAAIFPIDADTESSQCNNRQAGTFANVLYKNFGSLARKPRQVVLESLQEEIHDSSFFSQEAGVSLSEYRIVRVVDHSGAVHVIRKNTKTQFECSRQGYFSHPLGCNKFYRCVKFNQYTDDYTVFEYDCPDGLAFDERWEVCVWPGSLPHGAPCTGSSEIAPVPRSYYQCPTVEGYYADPENCRWFFACLDHARDGYTPLTAYEFRCPFGLVFDEEKLSCDWPWLVGGCGGRGAAGVVLTRTGGAFSHEASATFSAGSLNGGSGILGGAAGILGVPGAGYINANLQDPASRASFATVPDYVISGGRIASKEAGVVLNHNLPAFVVDNGGSSHRDNIVHAVSVDTPRPIVYNRPVPSSFVIDDGGASHRENHGAAYVHTPSYVVDDGGASHRENHVQAAFVNTPSYVVDDGGASHRGNFIQTVSHTPRPVVYNTPSSFIVDDGGASHRENQFQAVSVKPTGYDSVIVNDAGASHRGNVVQTVTQAPIAYNDLQFGQKLGYNYEKPAVAFDLPSKNAYLPPVYAPQAVPIQSVKISVPTTTINVTPKPLLQLQPPDVLATYAQAAPVLKHEVVPFVQRPAISLKPTFYQTQSYTPTPVVVQQHYVTPRPVIVQQEVIQPRPVIYKQEITPVVTPRPVVYQQQVVSHQPAVYQQQVVQSVTPKPVVYQQQVASPQPVVYQQQVTAKPVVYQQEVVQHTGYVYDKPKVQFDLPKPVVYQQEIVQPVVTPKPVVYQQQVVQSVTPKPVVYQQQVVSPQPVLYQQQVTAKPVVYQQEVVQQTGYVYDKPKVKFNLPKPVVYQQEIIQPVVTPKPVVYQQEIIQPVVTPKPVVYQQQIVQPAPKTVVYQQQYVSPKPVVYQQEIVQPVVTPKPVVYQQEIVQPVVTPKPVVYQQQYIAPKPVVYQQEVVQRVVTPKPVVYQQQPVVYQQEIVQPVVTPKPVVYQQQIVQPAPKQVVYQQQYVSPKPVVYQQEIVQPKPVVYQQEIVQPAPKPVVYQQQYVAPKPVVYQQEVVQPVVTPRPVVYQQEIVQPVVTPKPIEYRQRYVTPKPIVYQTPRPVLFQKQNVTPRPVFYQQQVAVTTPKPVIYQQEVYQQQIVSPKPVVYQQEVIQPLVTSKPVVYDQPKGYEYKQPKVKLALPEPVVYQQQVEIPKPVVYKQPVVTQQFVTQKPVEYQQEILQPVVTPKIYKQQTVTPVVYKQETPVVYQEEIVQPIEIPKRVVYKQPKPVVYEQQTPVVYQQEVAKPVVYQQPKVVYQEEYLKIKPVVQKQPKAYVYQQPEVQKIEYQQVTEQPLTYLKPEVRRPTVYIQPTTPKTAVYQQVFNVQQEIKAPVVTYQQETPVVYKTKVAKPVVYQSYDVTTPQYQEVTQRVVPLYPRRKIVQTTVRPTFIETVTPQIRLNERPIVVNDIPLINIQGKAETTPRTVYAEVYQRVNPGVAVLSKEINQAFDFVSTEAPKAYTAQEYLPPVTSTKSSIEIAPPPADYLVEIPSTTLRTRSRVRVRPTTRREYLPPATEPTREYLPPATESRRRGKARPGKTTIVSIGQVDKEELNDENLEGVLNKYGGRSGPLSEEDKEKFVTKVIKGDGRGTIRVGKEPEVSTVGYEITSSRQRSRGRSRTFSSTSTTTEATEDDTDTADVSLATLDLKNLKVKKNKKTVIVVSQVSDANPILIGKLAGQCSCQSNKVELKKGRRPSGSSDSDDRRPSNNEDDDDTPPPLPSRTNDDDEFIPLRRKPSNNEDDDDTPPPRSRSRRPQSGRSRPLGDDDGSSGNNDDDGGRPQSRRPGSRNQGSRRPVGEDDASDGEDGSRRPASGGEGSSRGPDNSSRSRRPPSGDDEGSSGNNDDDVGRPQSRRTGSRNQGTRRPTSDDEDGSRRPQSGDEGSSRSRRPLSGRSRSDDPSSPRSGKARGFQPEDDNAVIIGSPEPVYLDNIATEDGPNGPGQVNVEILNEDGAVVGTSSTTIIPEVSPSILLPLAPSRREKQRRIPSRSKAQVPFVKEESPLLTPISADVIAEEPKVRAGAAFDRYGPGGWRSADETLQGSVDCKRPGLFRHPKYCNKFYSCNYDPWKKRYTLAVFNCPVHLAYDSNIGACNWPSKGPACADDNLLV